MTVLLLTLRVLHIGFGVFWVGAVVFLNTLLGPSIMAAGPAGMKVMMELRRRQYVHSLLGAGAVTILSGMGLVWIDSRGFQPEWFRSHFGMAISTGMLVATIAWLLGLLVVHPTSGEMAALGAELELAASDEARAAIGQRMATARGRLIRYGAITMILMLVSVVTMAIARYV